MIDKKFRQMKFEKRASQTMPTWVKYYTPLIKITVCQVDENKFLLDIMFMDFKINLPGFYDMDYIMQIDKLTLK